MNVTIPVQNMKHALQANAILHERMQQMMKPIIQTESASMNTQG